VGVGTLSGAGSSEIHKRGADDGGQLRGHEPTNASRGGERARGWPCHERALGCGAILTSGGW
jgi:hypothetical protein